MVRELSMMGLELSHDEVKFMKTKNLSSFFSKFYLLLFPFSYLSSLVQFANNTSRCNL